jgi:pilus assembly protein CpaB
MFSRFLVVGLASLALACGIALVFYKVLGASDGRKRVPTRDVVVATAELPAGTRIRPQDIRIVAVPEEFAPQNSFQKMDEVRGRVVTNLVMKDEPVVPNRLAAPGSGPGLAPMIPAGYRAVSVRVNDVIGVAGFIQPGMRVDVLASGRLPNSEDSVTRTVLQNVVVLSAGQVLQPEPKGEVINAQVVTLQVRPDEAEILTLISGEGRIQLVLRNSSDTVVGPTPGAHLAAVYNAGTSSPAPAVNRHFERPVAAPPKPSAPPPPVPQTVPPRAIEIIRGTTRSDVALPDETKPKAKDKKMETEKTKVTRRLYAPYMFA